ncbi:MAG: hypothetical protein WC120_03140 [Parcubacteria group bacterium]
MMHISVCSLGDYDKLVAFLSKHDEPIANSDRERMVITAEISEKFVHRIYSDADIEDGISVWETVSD